MTSLHVASLQGHAHVVTALCVAGATVDRADTAGFTPLLRSCRLGRLHCVYGASRTGPNSTAERVSIDAGHAALTEWLVASRDWVSPLHHLSIISAAHAQSLLRDGANVHMAARVGSATPLSLAQALHTVGKASAGSPADLVLRAAKPWSPETHHLFPHRARRWAMAILRLGVLLSCQPRLDMF